MALNIADLFEHAADAFGNPPAAALAGASPERDFPARTRQDAADRPARLAHPDAVPSVAAGHPAA